MGLENPGFSIANHDLLWIDPIDYKKRAGLRGRRFGRRKGECLNLQSALLRAAAVSLAFCRAIDFRLEERLPAAVQRLPGQGSCAGFFSSGRPPNSRAAELTSVLDVVFER